MSGDRWAVASARAFYALVREPDLALGPDLDLATLASPWRPLAERLVTSLDEDGSGHLDAAGRLSAFLKALGDDELKSIGFGSRTRIVQRLRQAVEGRPLGDAIDELAEARQAHDDAHDAQMARESSPPFSEGTSTRGHELNRPENPDRERSLDPPQLVPSSTRAPQNRGARARLVRVDVGRMLREAPPPVPWIVEGVLARGNVTLLPGREGVGKSLFVMALVVGVVTGEPAGPFATTPGRVMVVDAENGESELHRRLRALGLAPGAEERLSIYTSEAGDLLNEREELAAAVADERPDLLVIDSFRSNWRGKENASDEAGPAVDHVRNLARRADCAVALIHHAGKVGGEYRGSTAIGAGSQIVVGVARHPDDPEEDRFVLTCAKMRPAPRWSPRWIRLAVEMGAIVCLEEAEPFIAEDAPPPAKAPAREKVAPQVARVLAGAGGPLALAEIARRVGRDPKDRTVRRVLEALAERGAARRTEDGWRGWQPHEPLRGVATPATPLSGAREPHSEADGNGGKQLATVATPEDGELDRWERLADGAS